jgi:hypothetical protein
MHVYVTYRHICVHIYFYKNMYECINTGMHVDIFNLLSKVYSSFHPLLRRGAAGSSSAAAPKSNNQIQFGKIWHQTIDLRPVNIQ